MPFRSPQLCLADILDGVAAIASFLPDVDIQRYRSDLLVRSAVERQLQIITETAFRFGEDADRLRPTLDWRGIRGLGNMLRYAYDIIDDERVWQITQTRLPPLKEAAREALIALEERGIS